MSNTGNVTLMICCRNIGKEKGTICATPSQFKPRIATNHIRRQEVLIKLRKIFELATNLSQTLKVKSNSIFLINNQKNRQLRFHVFRKKLVASWLRTAWGETNRKTRSTVPNSCYIFIWSGFVMWLMTSYEERCHANSSLRQLVNHLNNNNSVQSIVAQLSKTINWFSIRISRYWTSRRPTIKDTKNKDLWSSSEIVQDQQVLLGIPNFCQGDLHLNLRKKLFVSFGESMWFADEIIAIVLNFILLRSSYQQYKNAFRLIIFKKRASHRTSTSMQRFSGARPHQDKTKSHQALKN